jgi:tetratricopeptide (TPR) repeat protein
MLASNRPSKRLLPLVPYVLIAGIWGLTLSACASSVLPCLQTPPSSKVSGDALAICEKALEDNLDRRDVFARTVHLLQQRARYRDMATWSQKVVNADASRTDARYYLAVGLRKVGQCDEAILAYQAYAERNRDDADPYFGIALCYEKKNDPKNALLAYKLYVGKEKRTEKQSWVKRAQERIAIITGAPVATLATTQAPKVITTTTTRTTRAAAPAKAVVAPVATPVATTTTPATTGTQTTVEVTMEPGTPVAAPTPSPKTTTTTVAVSKPAPTKSTGCDKEQAAIAANPFDTDAYQRFAVCAAGLSMHQEIISKMRVALRDNPKWARGWLYLGRAQNAIGDVTASRASFAKACAASVVEACSQ